MSSMGARNADPPSSSDVSSVQRPAGGSSSSKGAERSAHLVFAHRGCFFAYVALVFLLDTLARRPQHAQYPSASAASHPFNSTAFSLQ